MFYPQKFPQPDDLVIGNVSQIQESFVYVQLMEYDLDQKAMLTKSELSRKRRFNVRQLIRLGKDEVFRVQRVDEKNGYVDLSKLDIQPADQQACMDSYIKAKVVHGLAIQLSEKFNLSLEDVSRMVCWPIYERFEEPYLENAPLVYQHFVHARDRPEDLQYINHPEIQSSLLDTLQVKFKSIPQIIRAVLNITCFTYRGVDDIIDAFREVSRPDITATYIAAPLYGLKIEHVDPATGIRILQENIDEITAFIAHAGGDCSVHTPPQILHDKELSIEEDDKILWSASNERFLTL